MKHDKKAITAMVTGMAIGAALVSEAAAGIVAEHWSLCTYTT